MTTGNRKTPKMMDAEAAIARPLEDALPEMINRMGLTGAARRLGVSKATLSYWMLKLGIEMHHVAIAPGYEIQVRRKR
jgi:transcriptional regulator with GAF, ATPase, and Fis domain